MDLRSPLNFIAQKLLYLWIKTEVIQENPTEDGSDIIYVVESRAWTDLLVLEHECHSLGISKPLSRLPQAPLDRWHHIYTVAQAQPLKAWLQQETKRSSMLIGIRDALKENPELDVRFVPVVVFWGRPVKKHKHWLRVLFSETWGFAGRTRRFFTILFNGKNTLIQFSPGISFRELIDEASSEDSDSIDHTQRRLARRLNEIRTATLGPDISHRRTLVRQLLKNPAIEHAIDVRRDQNNISLYSATRTAERYLQEIVADRSYITIQILQRILTAFWNRFYSGIDTRFSEPLKTLALTHELIYVPCHRSHIDYLLLSYVVHSEGLAIPYIAAGKNLNMPVIGSILRKGGAFFIRRSFRGNALYSTVLFEYLASQIASGMPIEYFVEGGRSRTGRLLQPKPGMLAMTIRSFIKYQKRPIAFVPVNIGYEKMIEGKAYLAELAGDDKKSETLFSSVRSILGIRGFYGQVTTSFGEAILLEDVLQQASPQWRIESYHEDQRPAWLSSSVDIVSQLIMQRINECCAVNPVNLVATILLACPNQAMDETELERTLGLYRKLITGLDYSSRISLTELDEREQVRHAEKLGMVRRRDHEMGDFIYLDRKQAIHLTYYRNNILHLMAMASLVACSFNNTDTQQRDTIIHYIKITYPFLRKEFFLPWSSQQLTGVIDGVLLQLCETGLLSATDDNERFEMPAIGTDQYAQMTTLSRIISPLLELYYMIFAQLAEHDAGSLSRDRLEQLCHLMAQRLSLMYEINSPDFFDLKLIANFIDTLIAQGYVETDSLDRLSVSELAIKEGRYARRLLSRDIQYNILQMLRSNRQHAAE